VRAIILDIEGTTTPLAFVHSVLFPYARAHVARFLEQQAASSPCAAALDRLRDEHARETSADPPPPWVDQPTHARTASATAYVGWLMDRDRKSTGLKALQGLIWEHGYRTGEIAGEVFDDVRPAFERWSAAGVGMGIFSSGSVLAQKLLFKHSSAGDLTPFLQWHFDTTLGAKTEAASYRRVAEAIGLPADAVLFMSDVVRELDAAREAGMRTALVARPGNAPSPFGHGHVVVHSFAEM
jgi:enolase-phosphatase E1